MTQPQRRPLQRRRLGGATFAAMALVLILVVYFIEQPLALSGFGVASLANASLALVLVTMGQSCVLFAGGLDLSAGAIVSLVDCLAATLMGDSPGSIALTPASPPARWRVPPTAC